MKDPASVEQRASRVKLLLMDCDGVLTDGRIWILENLDDQKAFNTHDGLGLELLHRAGLRSGVISGRTSSALARRAQALGMSYVKQGFSDKRAVFEEILVDANVSHSEVAYIGDDLTDIPLMRLVEFSIAVGDATMETRGQADYVTKAVGGNGAIREVVELILKAQGRWNELLKTYLD